MVISCGGAGVIEDVWLVFAGSARTRLSFACSIDPSPKPAFHVFPQTTGNLVASWAAGSMLRGVTSACRVVRRGQLEEVRSVLPPSGAGALGAPCEVRGQSLCKQALLTPLALPARF